MALTYELAKIENFKELCFVGEGDDAPMNGVTEALIFSTISIGMPELTQANWEEFYIRLTVLETLYGAPMKSQGGDVSFTQEDVRQHIGLKTNATAYTKAKFNSEMGRILRERATQKMYEERKELQPANA